MITVNEYVRTTGSYINSGNDYRLFSTNSIVYATPVSAAQSTLFNVYLITGGRFVTDSAGITSFGADLVSVNEYNRSTGKLKNTGLPIKINVNNVSTIFPSGTGYELNGTTPINVVRVRLANDKAIITDEAGITALSDIPAILVVTTYPTTTSSLAGTRFLYKGNEWHYMTQDEIDSTGWTGLVTVGFPAPVVKNYNVLIGTDYTTTFSGGITNGMNTLNTFTVVDTLGLGNPTKVKSFSMASFPSAVTSIKNAKLLTSVADIGTIQGITITNGQLSATALNAFFTDLPTASATCTINASGNPGSATCNPTIATAKGYTVVIV